MDRITNPSHWTLPYDVGLKHTLRIKTEFMPEHPTINDGINAKKDSRGIAVPGAQVKYIPQDRRNKNDGLGIQHHDPQFVRRMHSSVMTDKSLLSEDEKRLIRRHYLGDGEDEEEVQKRVRRGDRKIHFDWDEADDTGALLDHNKVPLTRVNLPARNSIEIRTIDEFGNEVVKTINSGQSNGSGTSRKVDDRHWSEKRLDEMMERDWRILKEDFGISISGGGNLARPLRYWKDGLPSRIVELIKEVGYGDPTPIQRQCIPLIIGGRDIIGIAETGSGKTAAFLLPMICQILRLAPLRNEEAILDGPYGLILAPTRELVLQIEQEAKKFCRPLGLSVLSIVGGHSMAEQSVNLRRGAEILVATPGRLRDCLEQHVLALRQCYNLVLDEADRMIDLNFEPDLQYILRCLPVNLEKPDSLLAESPESLSGKFRQTTMFSATMPVTVEKLARAYLKRPATVTVGTAGQAADTVEQIIELINPDNKDKRLLEILDSETYPYPIIIFVNQKRIVDFLYNRLQALGYRCIALHGGKGQEQRESAIASIRRRQRDILIATDVAGRGIDIPDVSLVVNYDMARSIDDYIHRIGRTGRMGQNGSAITFLTLEDSLLFYELRLILQKATKSRVPEEFLQHEATRTKPGTVIQKRRQDERIYAYGV